MNIFSWTGILMPAALAGMAVSSATANDAWGLLAAAATGAGAAAWRRWGRGGAAACPLPAAPPSPEP